MYCSKAEHPQLHLESSANPAAFCFRVKFHAHGRATRINQSHIDEMKYDT